MTARVWTDSAPRHDPALCVSCLIVALEEQDKRRTVVARRRAKRAAARGLLCRLVRSGPFVYGTCAAMFVGLLLLGAFGITL